jgi:hypothetical protein
MGKENAYLVARGTPPLVLRYGEPPTNRVKLAQEVSIGTGAEQVAYLQKDTLDGIPSLNTMGNELSGNSLLVAAFALGGRGQLRASGINGTIDFRNEGIRGERGASRTTIDFQLPFKYDPQERVVLLGQGIGYEFTDALPFPLDTSLERIATKYRLPAFGAISSSINEIAKLWVYVAETRTVVPESVCASASIALAIKQEMDERELTGVRYPQVSTYVTQPSGGRIQVMRYQGDRFSISAQVRKEKIDN